MCYSILSFVRFKRKLAGAVKCGENVWLSYFLCMKDMEMSCDESVMKKMGDGACADYSQTLLSLATGRKIFAGTPLFFGEGDAKSRIKNILKYKKPTMWAVAAGVIAVVILCVGYMGNPQGQYR